MLTPSQIIFRLILAILCGGIIGWERELRAKTAGLRTHILLCLASSLAMLLAINFASQNYSGVDVTRIAAGVLQGIGLLCVAAVLRYKESVVGLSTSASLWMVAVVGLAVGAGFYFPALITTIFCLLILFFLSQVEDRYIRKNWPKKLIIKISREPHLLEEIFSLIQTVSDGIKIIELKKNQDDQSIELVIEICNLIRKKTLEEILKLKGIIKVEEIKEPRF